MGGRTHPAVGVSSARPWFEGFLKTPPQRGEFGHLLVFKKITCIILAYRLTSSENSKPVNKHTKHVTVITLLHQGTRLKNKDKCSISSKSLHGTVYPYTKENNSSHYQNSTSISEHCPENHKNNECCIELFAVTSLVCILH